MCWIFKFSMSSWYLFWFFFQHKKLRQPTGQRQFYNVCIHSMIYLAMHQVFLCKHRGNHVTRSAAKTLDQGSNLLSINLSCLVALILVLIASSCTIYVFIAWYILQCIRYVYANTGEIMSPDLQQQLWAKGQIYFYIQPFMFLYTAWTILDSIYLLDGKLQ